MENNNSEDIELFYAISQGNEKAFDLLFKKYYLVLCTYASHFVSSQDAEDVVLDVMLWFWENRSKISVERSIKSYLFRAVYHRSINKIMQDDVRQRVDMAFHERTLSALQDIDIAHLNELSIRIKNAINELPEAYKEAFILHRFRNLSYKEAAEKLNVSSKTIDYRIQQALKLLRIKLKDYLLLLFYIVNV